MQTLVFLCGSPTPLLVPVSSAALLLLCGSFPGPPPRPWRGSGACRWGQMDFVFSGTGVQTQGLARARQALARNCVLFIYFLDWSSDSVPCA